VRVGKDGAATFTLDPGKQPANQTLVITTSTGPAARRQPANSLSIAMARGKVAPCVPVKDTRPCPPPAPSGKDEGGPSLNESFGPAVEAMDLTGFYASYRQDGHGRAADEPSMMVALLLYAYARGARSSRAVERACEEDIAYRVIAANQRPDHATLARFVERHEEALAGLFSEVLGLCAEAGLVKAGVIAIDGTKLRADASREANSD